MVSVNSMAEINVLSTRCGRVCVCRGMRLGNVVNLALIPGRELGDMVGSIVAYSHLDNLGLQSFHKCLNLLLNTLLGVGSTGP